MADCFIDCRGGHGFPVYGKVHTKVCVRRCFELPLHFSMSPESVSSLRSLRMILPLEAGAWCPHWHHACNSAPHIAAVQTPTDRSGRGRSRRRACCDAFRNFLGKSGSFRVDWLAGWTGWDLATSAGGSGSSSPGIHSRIQIPRMTGPRLIADSQYSKRCAKLAAVIVERSISPLASSPPA